MRVAGWEGEMRGSRWRDAWDSESAINSGGHAVVKAMGCRVQRAHFGSSGAFKCSTATLLHPVLAAADFAGCSICIDTYSILSDRLSLRMLFTFTSATLPLRMKTN